MKRNRRNAELARSEARLLAAVAKLNDLAFNWNLAGVVPTVVGGNVFRFQVADKPSIYLVTDENGNIVN